MIVWMGGRLVGLIDGEGAGEGKRRKVRGGGQVSPVLVSQLRNN